MKKEFRAFAAMLAVLFAALACNLPGRNDAVAGGDAVLTAAAETVAAQLEGQEFPPPTTPSQPTEAQPTATTESLATNTKTPTPTTTQIPCNQVTFVKDVTIPDGEVVEASDTFTKTWRLKNSGSCTWNSDYDLVFDSGNQMNAPASKPLTGGSVAPGANVDVSVDLKAPNSAGTYKAVFQLRDDDGVIFTTGGIWVEIEVEDASPTSHTVTLTNTSRGSVRENGAVLNPANVGDTVDNFGAQAFYKWDFSGIPNNATITKVKIKLVTTYDTLGDPFGSLGCLRAYKVDVFPLDSADYFTGTAVDTVLRWCDTGQIDDGYLLNDNLLNKLQDAVGDASFELRFQFKETESDDDNVADMVRMSAEVTLKITYTVP